MPEIAASGSVTGVVVYARGAEVTRTIPLAGPFVAEAFDVHLSGLPLHADAGSFRASVEGGREVVALRSRIVSPPAPVRPVEASAKLRELDRERRRLEAEREEVAGWRDGVATVSPEDDLHGRSGRPDPLGRTRDSLAVNRLASALVAEQETRLLALDDALERNGREREAAQLAASQASSSQREPAPRPSREVFVRFAPGPVEGPLTLTLSYAVAAARWWPAHQARLGPGGTRVEWALEAFVAQASGEDWTGVQLSLATADRLQEVQLPELASIRFGRAQPPARRGYRPPPAGLDELFAGFDLQRALLRPPPPAPRMRAPPAPLPPPPPSPAAMKESDASLDEDMPSAPMRSRAYAEARPMPSFAGAPAPAAKADKEMKKMKRAGGGGASMGFAEGAPPEPEEPSGPQAIEPADRWLDFDTLLLASGEHRGQRGRLQRETSATDEDGPAARALESLASPRHAVDPRDGRGQFDHRYDSARPLDVPSDGIIHRVTLVTASAEVAPRFVTVPRENAAVYRSAEFVNPFDGPLLAGPVDVFVDGALVTTSPLSKADRGGKVSLSIGVEERLRVARNVRAAEETTGLLGGSVAVKHEVSIELSSSLARSVRVDVFDRTPVADDDQKDLEVKLIPGTPAPEPYDQAERGAAVKGGLRFRLDVPAAGRAAASFGYRLVFPSRDKVVGGNRRE